MEKGIGLLLKRKRLEHNLSQESLCHGLCVPSYLSKIEQGTANPAEDLLMGLFAAMGESLCRDQVLLAEAEYRLGQIIEAALKAPLGEGDRRWLEEHTPVLSCSPLFLRLALARISAALAEDKRETARACLEELEPLQPHMSTGDAALYLVALSDLERHGDTDRRVELLDRAVRLHPAAYSMFRMADAYSDSGRFHQAVLQAERAFDMAVAEGDLHWMAHSRFLQMGCYAIENALEPLLDGHESARRLCVGENAYLAYHLDYNLGATLTGVGRHAEALVYLRRAEAGLEQDGELDSALVYHKLCISLGELGRWDEGQPCLERMEALADSPLLKCLATCLRLRYAEGRADSPEYLAALEEAYRIILDMKWIGLQRFHGRFLLEAYMRRRRYKEALAVSLEAQKSIFPRKSEDQSFILSL